MYRLFRTLTTASSKQALLRRKAAGRSGRCLLNEEMQLPAWRSLFFTLIWQPWILRDKCTPVPASSMLLAGVPHKST